MMILIYIISILLYSCNVNGNTGIFYGVVTEYKNEKSNLDKYFSATKMTEDNDDYYLKSNTVLTKNKSEINWNPINEFSFDFFLTKTAKNNCKDIATVEIDGKKRVFASFSVDDNYNKFESKTNPEFNKDFKLNYLCMYNKDSKKWDQVNLNYPSLLNDFITDKNGDGEDDFEYRQLEIQNIFSIDNSLFLLFNERFIRKKYTILDENGKEITNTEQAVKAPLFRLYRVDNILTSPTLTEVKIKYEDGSLKQFLPSSIIGLDLINFDVKPIIWFASAKNIYKIQNYLDTNPVAEIIDITLSSKYNLKGKIETIKSFYVSYPSPYLEESDKTLEFNGIKYAINNKPSIYMALNYYDASSTLITRIIRYTKTYQTLNSNNNSSILFNWEWVECSYTAVSDSVLLLYNFSNYYNKFFDEKLNKYIYINKILIGTTTGYLEGNPLDSTVTFIKQSSTTYDDITSTSTSNLSTLKLNTSTIQYLYLSQSDTNSKLFATTPNSGVWVNENRVWRRE